MQHQVSDKSSAANRPAADAAWVLPMSYFDTNVRRTAVNSVITCVHKASIMTWQVPFVQRIVYDFRHCVLQNTRTYEHRSTSINSRHTGASVRLVPLATTCNERRNPLVICDDLVRPLPLLRRRLHHPKPIQRSASAAAPSDPLTPMYHCASFERPACPKNSGVPPLPLLHKRHARRAAAADAAAADAAAA